MYFLALLSCSLIDVYMDDYPSCAETYVTLRIYAGSMSPDEVSKMLRVKATRIEHEAHEGSRRIRHNAWFLCSKGEVKSRDARRHIDWLADQLRSNLNAYRDVRRKCTAIDLTCYWRATHGAGGGPTLSPAQMEKLADLELDIWYDLHLTRS